jgi:hypothetical protein
MAYHKECILIGTTTANDHTYSQTIYVSTDESIVYIYSCQEMVYIEDSHCCFICEADLKCFRLEYRIKNKTSLKIGIMATTDVNVILQFAKHNRNLDHLLIDHTLHQKDCKLKDFGPFTNISNSDPYCFDCNAPMDIEWIPNMNQLRFQMNFLWDIWNEQSTSFNSFIQWIPEEVLKELPK